MSVNYYYADNPDQLVHQIVTVIEKEEEWVKYNNLVIAFVPQPSTDELEKIVDKLKTNHSLPATTIENRNCSGQQLLLTSPVYMCGGHWQSVIVCLRAPSLPSRKMLLDLYFTFTRAHSTLSVISNIPTAKCGPTFNVWLIRCLTQIL
jgi:hypothetical protein